MKNIDAVSQHWSMLMQAIGSGAAMRIGAIILVFAALAVAATQTRRADETERDAVVIVSDPLAAELTRCRTVTLEQLAADDTCRRVWAENRRRFFAPSRPAEVR